MFKKTSTSLITHFDQVDYNRHINGSAYEQLANHARHEILADLGWDAKSMLADGLRARPLASRMQFLRQQDAGTRLTVETEADFRGDGVVYWTQDIRNEERDETACRIEMESRLEKKGVPAPLPNRASDDAPSAPTPEFSEFSEFRGECHRVEFTYRTRYADGNYFEEISPSVIWKMVEECRQTFAAHVGLTVENCLKHDVLLFTSAGEYRFDAEVPPARELKCSIWLDELEKIRCGMRHEIADAETGAVLHRAREAFIVVAPSKMRPRRAPDFMMEAVRDYLAPEPAPASRI